MDDLKGPPQPTVPADPMQGYKETELGLLPEEWTVARLGEIGKLADGDWILNKDYADEGVRLLQVGDVGLGSYVEKSQRFVSLDRAVELMCSFLEQGQLLISRMPNPIGRACLVPQLPYPLITAVDVSILTPDEDKIDSGYLLFVLNSDLMFRQCARLATGVTRQRISRRNLETVQIPTPSLPEQGAIAHVLRTVQKAKETTEQVIEATRELKRSLMNHLFTYGPVPVDEAERVPLKETEIGPVPEHWSVDRFEELVEIKRGQVDPTEEPYSKMPHIGPENIESGTGKILPTKSAEEIGLISGKYLFSDGDVLYSKIRPYLRKAALPSFKGICSADMYPVRPRDEVLIRDFLYFFLLHERFTIQAISFQSRTGIPKINRTQLGMTLLPVPSVKEQEQITHILLAVDQKIEVEEKRKQSMEVLFRTLLHNLMTGKVRVTDLNLSKAGELV